MKSLKSSPSFPDLRGDTLTDVVAYLFLILALLRYDRETVAFEVVAGAIAVLSIIAFVRLLLRLGKPRPESEPEGASQEGSLALQRRKELMRRGIRMAAYFGLLTVILRDIPSAVVAGSAVVACLLAAVAAAALFSKRA